MKITKECIGASFWEEVVHYEFELSPTKKMIVKYSKEEDNLGYAVLEDGKMMESGEYTDWWNVMDALIDHTKENGSCIIPRAGTILLRKNGEIVMNKTNEKKAGVSLNGASLFR